MQRNLRCEKIHVRHARKTGTFPFLQRFSLCGNRRKIPCRQFSFQKIASGCVLEFPIADDCHIYGFGLQLKQFDHRGRKLRLDVNADPVSGDGETHAPVPFFVTNQGYGMYFDTARYAEFYCGKQKNNGRKTPRSRYSATGSEAELYAVRKDTDLIMSVRIPVAAGIDVYVIEGDTITDIVSQYNLLAGGGPVVPTWSLGFFTAVTITGEQNR